MKAAEADLAAENAQLRSQLAGAERERDEALEQQAAAASVLRIIAAAPTNLEQALSKIAITCGRLLATTDVAIWQRDGEIIRVVAQTGRGVPLGLETPLQGTFPAARAIRESRAFQLEADNSKHFDHAPIRQLAFAPLLRAGEAIGVISVPRFGLDALPLTAAEVALLATFADQAVIAIENARLFSELQESLEQQTATGSRLPSQIPASA